MTIALWKIFQIVRYCFFYLPPCSSFIPLHAVASCLRHTPSEGWHLLLTLQKHTQRATNQLGHLQHMWRYCTSRKCVCLWQLQEKRENSGAQTHKLRDLQQQASDKIKVRDFSDRATGSVTALWILCVNDCTLFCSTIYRVFRLNVISYARFHSNTYPLKGTNICIREWCIKFVTYVIDNCSYIL